MRGFSAAAERQAVPYLLAEVLALTVMGSFWGLSVQLVTFREQGILRRFRVAPVGGKRHAGFQPALELFPDIADDRC